MAYGQSVVRSYNEVACNYNEANLAETKNLSQVVKRH